jgi:YHS domain-containing protein
MKNFIFILVALFISSCSQNTGEVNTSKVDAVENVTVKGYDVVAYFKASSPIKGSREFSHKYQNVKWFFSSKKNLELFKKDPKKYVPQYGGYCAFGVAVPNKKIDIDPDSWYIKDQKLYLNYSKPTQKVWLSNIDDNIDNGDENWEELKDKE